MANIKKILKGVGINKYSGTGVVLKVTSYKDFSKVTGGEVVVTQNATPDYILILKKIACLVANEGCSTSHIAIVCREMNTPAILGTGLATKHLKNGQLVQYDTQSGLVEVISEVSSNE